MIFIDIRLIRVENRSTLPSESLDFSQIPPSPLSDAILFKKQVVFAYQTLIDIPKFIVAMKTLSMIRSKLYLNLRQDSTVLSVAGLIFGMDSSFSISL